MSRRAEFSLIYEIIGLVIFSITALVWFGGVESMVGGLTTSRPIRSFNALTTAISNVCTNGETNFVEDLDLNTPGSTFLITQLRIPEDLTNDPLTIGSIQPSMRKCVGANCLCLVELNELDGNWQMCATSDFDSSNIGFGGITGPPGCPFWYYAPPRMIDLALQGLIDMLDWDYATIFLGYFFDNPDPTEKYSFPAPELWGGCVGAKDSALDISSFSKKAQLDCSKISKPLTDFYDTNPLSGFINFLTYDFSDFSSFISGVVKGFSVSSLIKDFIVSDVKSVIDDDFRSIISDYFNDLARHGFSNVESVINSFNGSPECSRLVFNNLTAYTNVLLTSDDDLVSNDSPLNSFDLNGHTVSLLFNSINTNQTISAVNISFIAEGDYVNVWLGGCVNKVIVNSSLPIVVSTLFASDCLSDYRIDFNGDALLFYGSSNADFLIDESPSTNGFIINVSFINPVGNSVSESISQLIADQLISNSLNSGSFNCLRTTNSFVCDGFINCLIMENEVGDSVFSCDNTACYDSGSNVICYFGDGTINCNGDGSNYHCTTDSLTAYSLSVAYRLFNNNLIVSQSVINDYNDYYNVFFSNLVLERVYERNGDECSLYHDIPEEIFNSFNGVRDELVSGVNDSFNEGINSMFSELIVSGTPSISNASPIINGIRDSLVDYETPIITKSINDCLVNEGLSSVNELIVKEMLNNIFTSDVSDVKHQINNLINNEFSISVPINSLLINHFNSLPSDYVSHSYSIISERLKELSRQVSDKIESVVSSAWTGTAFHEVNCWPNVGDGGYFTGYDHVNDLLAWRRYISVSRLTPLLMVGELKVLQSGTTYVANKMIGKVFMRIDSPLFVKNPKPIKDFSEVVWSNVPLSQRMSSQALFNLFYPSGFFVYSIPKGDFNLPTGYLIKVFKYITKNYVLNPYVKRILLERILALSIKVGLNIGFNLWKNTIISTFVSEEVIYSHGGIRSFDPQMINVLSCVRMDELGCNKLDSVWVNESTHCSTDIYVRRLTNPNTWINFLKEKDYCGFASDSCTEGDVSSCRKDLLSACYEVNCRQSKSIGERYHVFEYWVGADTDPANVIGTKLGHIDVLKVSKANVPQNGEHILLEVVGSGSGIPTTII